MYIPNIKKEASKSPIIGLPVLLPEFGKIVKHKVKEPDPEPVKKKK